MRSLSMLAALAPVIAATPVQAQPTSDIAGWAQRFTQAALTSDADEMTGLLKEVADPRLNMDGVRSVVQGAINIVKSQTPEYSEQFNNKDIGDFIKRINVAVKYSAGLLFYSVVAVRGANGWQVVQVNIDGNLNKILDAPWPS